MRRIRGLGAIALAVLFVQPAAQGEIKSKGPHPDTEAAVRFTLQDLESGKPTLSNLTPRLAAIAKSQLPEILATNRSLGPVRSIAFRAVSPEGADIYEVEFAHGTMEWRIAPLTKDGKIDGLDTRREYVLKHLVDIGGGRHLNMVCTGKGSPTVVFLQGLNGDITNWRAVREPVEALTRACFYDRAGFGYSDPSDKPMTAETVADDLHALLGAAGIKDRVVLVGQSLGGLFATYYADKFFPDVAGMVLVDPSADGQFDYARGPADQRAFQQEADQFTSLMKTCTTLARSGGLSAGDNHKCFTISSVMPNETEYLAHHFRQPSYYAAMLSELQNFNPAAGTALDGEQERGLKRSFGNMPLVVLTAGLTFDDTTFSEAGKKAGNAAWKSAHDKLAQRSTRGESILLPNAHHFIQANQPDAVVEAIRKVVLEARQ